MTARVTAYIGLGANLGDPQTSVERAIAALNSIPHTSVTAQSSLFCTAPIDATGDDYVNAVAQIATTLPAIDLLAALQQVENAAGRQRPYPNAPRVLDLDLLLYGTEIIRSATLTVPHPRLTERAFTLIPLLQIDALIHIPGRGPAHDFVAGIAGQSIRKII